MSPHPHSPRARLSNSDDLADDHFFEDAPTLNQSVSQEHANQVMDELEMLRAERFVSQEEKVEAATGRLRSKSMVRNRHRPEATPDDVFDTLTAPLQIPQTQPAEKKKLNVLMKIFKTLRRFPRAIRYFVYVSTAPVYPLQLLIDAQYTCCITSAITAPSLHINIADRVSRPSQ